MFNERALEFEGGAFTPRCKGAQPKTERKSSNSSVSVMYGTVSARSLRQMHSTNRVGELRYGTRTDPNGRRGFRFH